MEAADPRKAKTINRVWFDEACMNRRMRFLEASRLLATIGTVPGVQIASRLSAAHPPPPPSQFEKVTHGLHPAASLFPSLAGCILRSPAVSRPTARRFCRLAGPPPRSCLSAATGCHRPRSLPTGSCLGGTLSRRFCPLDPSCAQPSGRGRHGSDPSGGAVRGIC